MTQTTKLRNRSDAALKGSSAAPKLVPGSDAAAHQFASQLWPQKIFAVSSADAAMQNYVSIHENSLFE